MDGVGQGGMDGVGMDGNAWDGMEKGRKGGMEGFEARSLAAAKKTAIVSALIEEGAETGAVMAWNPLMFRSLRSWDLNTSFHL